MDVDVVCICGGVKALSAVLTSELVAVCVEASLNLMDGSSSLLSFFQSDPILLLRLANAESSMFFIAMLTVHALLVKSIKSNIVVILGNGSNNSSAPVVHAMIEYRVTRVLCDWSFMGNRGTELGFNHDGILLNRLIDPIIDKKTAIERIFGSGIKINIAIAAMI